jgi:hypothetical protein
VFWYKYLTECQFLYTEYTRKLAACITFLNKTGTALISMQTKKNLLVFVAIAVLVGAVAYPTTSDVIGQIYDAKKESTVAVLTQRRKTLKTNH